MDIGGESHSDEIRAGNAVRGILSDQGSLPNGCAGLGQQQVSGKKPIPFTVFLAHVKCRHCLEVEVSLKVQVRNPDNPDTRRGAGLVVEPRAILKQSYPITEGQARPMLGIQHWVATISTCRNDQCTRILPQFRQTPPPANDCILITPSTTATPVLLADVRSPYVNRWLRQNPY